MSMEDIPEMLQDCENRESKLSAWEQSFLQSLSEQYTKKGSLSEKQYDILEKIWNRVT